ncbi:MAG: type III secretion system export apparatus subunit SctU [Pseudomonadales bacterium]|nr:type III secretion system export apparatus subunit SctU [Pseudomonadales bacterium]
MSQEKKADQTEKPTAKRLKDARKDGDIHQSQDLSKTFLLLVWVGLFALLMDYIFSQVYSVFHLSFIEIANTKASNNPNLIQSGAAAVEALINSLLPLLLVASALGIFISFIQIGVVFAPKKLIPKLEHINPIGGLKRIFSQRNLIEFLKSIFKTVLLICIILFILYAFLADILRLPMGSTEAVLATYWQVTKYVFGFSIFAFLFVSILDAFYQRHDYIKNLMMSRSDIKKEQKDMEGDPEIKGKRRQLHQEWSENNVLSSVRKANVVVTNPTHYAVALYYQKDETDLPIVIAKGEDWLAQRIKQVAEEEGIPVMENVSLARGLYADIKENQHITREYFKAVAEVLKWAEDIRKNAEQSA